MMRSPTREHGIAVIVAVMTTMVMLALGSALVLLTMSETAIASNFRMSSEALYAAEAIAERAMSDVTRARDWSRILNGSVRGTFVDGLPSGPRTLSDGTTIDLTQITNLANCERVTTCRGADMDAITTERPWGRNNPRWQLYAFGTLESLIGTGLRTSPAYVVAFVSDDPTENDDDPATDGGIPATGEPANPGAGRLMIRAQVFGATAQSSVEMTVQRTLRIVSWREVR